MSAAPTRAPAGSTACATASAPAATRSRGHPAEQHRARAREPTRPAASATAAARASPARRGTARTTCCARRPRPAPPPAPTAAPPAARQATSAWGGVPVSSLSFHATRHRACPPRAIYAACGLPTAQTRTPHGHTRVNLQVPAILEIGLRPSIAPAVRIALRASSAVRTGHRATGPGGRPTLGPTAHRTSPIVRMVPTIGERRPVIPTSRQPSASAEHALHPRAFVACTSANSDNRISLLTAHGAGGTRRRRPYSREVSARDRRCRTVTEQGSRQGHGAR